MTTAAGDFYGVCGKLVYAASITMADFVREGKAVRMETRRYTCGHVAEFEYASPLFVPVKLPKSPTAS